MPFLPQKTNRCQLVIAATLLAALLWAPVHLTAQDSDEAFKPGPDAFNVEDAPPEARRELDALLGLTLEQQRQRARTLIKEYPNTELAKTLTRLLNEYETFRELDTQSRLAQEARASYVRAYWHSRCCPLPDWNPPRAQLTNATSTPVLYQQKLDGIHATVWSGPYRIRPAATYDSPYPFRVRYLTAAGPVEVCINPGTSFAFQGSADDGTLQLVPGHPETAPPTLADPDLSAPMLPLPTE